MDFAKRLKELRNKRELSQEDLASMIKKRITGDIRRNTISNYENKKSTPDLETLEALGHILGTDMNDLLGFQPENSDVIKSLALEADPPYKAKEFLKPFENKVEEIKKVLVSMDDISKKELLKYLRSAVKMIEDLIRKAYELYEKNDKANSFIRRELDPS
ncbi:helix-turn-helix transcriptional regulator [Fulvivirga sp. M361]|uniref:helix-turn-helix domain-containing protein n=1 Tax=Fulvivirga sp. M361 TaxID=2594266 RepID=UPI00117A0924|nr:helix-turn-helix transcriptional regulator [Fulvivirga sp. M361]TRX56245.1 helix-turn-helix transcriptional regulator [Fulvivirga sp. M361]